MARSLPQLDAELNSLIRHPAGSATVERFLPEWAEKISGVVTNAEYAHSHAACTNDAGAIFRARSGSYSNPQDGKLYVAIIDGADLNSPEDWDNLWIDTGISGLMYPAWTSDSGAARGGSIAAADTGSAFRVFFVLAGGQVQYVDVPYTYTGPGGLSGTTITTLSSTALYGAQIACCKHDELFIHKLELVEDQIPGAYWNAWQVWGSFIERWYYSSGWHQDRSFHFHTHAEGGLLRDTPFESGTFSSSSWNNIQQQWGKRFCGGLAAFNIDNDTAVVALGLTFWRRFGYNTHTQAIHSFIYHRDSGWWERGFEAGNADFEDRYRLDFDVFARGCQVAGSNFLVWSRFLEPSDYEQKYDAQAIPRHSEVVYAKVSDDGKHITQWQYLGPPATMTAASLVKANDKLYALGWRSVYESPLATLLDEANDDKEDLELAITGWKASRNNRWGMTVGLDVEDASKLFEADTAFKSGSIVRVNYGTEAEQVQIAQGYLDISSPTISVAERSHEAKFNARADKLLLDTHAEAMDDILPQETKYIPPTDPIKHVSRHNGYWALAKGNWDSLFFGNAYGMASTPVYRLYSFPYAYTGGGGGYGDPGRILNERPQYKGTWWKDVVWLAHTPMVDGMVQASVRFGDIYNWGQFSFTAADGNTVYATISRSNGLIAQIQWRIEGYGGPIWNYVNQEACMAGVICHAPDLGKKYAFVWEADSNFASSSHTDDTWKKEDFDKCDFGGLAVGDNRLYLVVSDYDDTDANWKANKKWVHRAVAGATVATGLSPGQPADLRMQVLGGSIFCFYRLYSNGAPNQWRLAFPPYKAGRFGAGRFGIVGRGHAGIQWDVLYPGKYYIEHYDNYVDFWNIHLSDCVIDRPMEEILRKRIWQGFTASEFEAKVEEASRVVNAGTTHFYDTAVENLTVDFKVNIPGSGYEAGVFLRGVNYGNPTAECIRLGLIAHSTPNSQGNPVNYYVVKRYYVGGAEQSSYREYAPIPLQVSPGKPIPVRITTRGKIYTVWIAGNYAGHFHEDVELGVWWGLYAVGGNATFTNIRVPGLYEVPEFSTVEIDQAFGDAAKRIINKRRIKGVFTHDGKLKLSYFDSHEDGGSYEDSLIQNTYERSDRFISVIRAEGAWTHAQYSSPVMLTKGRRFQLVHIPDIYHREFCYREAKTILTEIAERQGQATFKGLPDPRTEPEDEIEIIVSQQGIAGDFLVDDSIVSFSLKDKEAEMTLSTRQKVIL